MKLLPARVCLPVIVILALALGACAPRATPAPTAVPANAVPLKTSTAAHAA